MSPYLWEIFQEIYELMLLLLGKVVVKSSQQYKFTKSDPGLQKNDQVPFDNHRFDWKTSFFKDVLSRFEQHKTPVF